MKKPPALDLHCHGYVTQDELQKIRSTLEECYPHLGRWLPEKVDIQIFDTSTQLAIFLDSEKMELGIGTSGDEAFICTHDAWRGFPRLLICLERLSALPLLAQLGTLRHEAAHTVLHGALAYYVFRLSPEIIELAQAKEITQPLLQQVLYYCAIAVKDLEVTRLLLQQGYSECQLVFVQTQFLPSEDDKRAWLLAKDNPMARLLFFSGQLKTLFLGWPLETAGLWSLEKSTDSMLNYINPEERKQLLGIAINIAQQLGEDTHDNVRLTLKQALQELL